MPLVSVVISSYNYSRYLREAIDSVLHQTFGNIEVIVVDDGSTDGSIGIIESYGDRIRKVLKPNGGHGSCINAGFAASRGDIVMFMDADDRYLPDAVASVVEALRSGAVHVQFRARLIDERGQFIAIYPWKRVRLDTGNVVPTMLSRGTFTSMVSTANAFRRDVLERLLPLDEKAFAKAPDGYLVHAVPFHGPIAAIDRPLAEYRIHGNNDSTSYRVGAQVDVQRLRGILGFSSRELEVVRSNAARCGLEVPEDLAWRHMRHLQLRLGSLVLDAATHPFAGDTVLRLGLRGAVAALRNAALPPERRFLNAIWFLGVGTLPARVKGWLVEQAFLPGRRSRFLRTRWSGQSSG